MSEYKVAEIRNGFERRIEDILVDIIRIKGPDGCSFLLDTREVIIAFSKLMDELEEMYMAEKRYLIIKGSDRE